MPIPGTSTFSGGGLAGIPASGTVGFWTRTPGAPSVLTVANAGDVVRFEDGTVGAPAISFRNGPTSGFRLAAAGPDDVRLVVGGVDTILALAASVQVGIAGTHTLSCPGAGANSERFGAGASSSTAVNVVVVGNGATAPAGASLSVVIGDSAICGDATHGLKCVIVGANAVVGTGSNNVLIGYFASARWNSVVIGYLAAGPASGTGNGVVIGYQAAGGDNSVAVGRDSAAGTNSVAAGYQADASGGVARIAIGSATVCNADNAFYSGSPSTTGYNITTVLFGRGDTHAGAALTVTHRTSNGTGTDVVGDIYAVQAGLGTGNSGNTTGAITGGAITFATGTPLGTGATLQTAAVRMAIYPGGLVLFRSQVANLPTSLTSAANSTPIDASLGNTFHATLTENTTFQNPTNMEAGATYVFRVVQAAGLFTVAFAANWKFPGGTAPTITAVNGAVDIITAYTPDGTLIEATFAQNLS